jgi:DNA-binding SARP family transcriptional activator
LDPTVTVQFDATTFERDVDAALARLKREGLPPASSALQPGIGERLLESALALYRGDFLEHEGAGDWHLDLRDRLRLKYVAALTTLAERRMSQERWAEAADTWRNLIGRDGLDERACRGLMTCHARLGERSQVPQVYKRLEQVLQRELEAKPEPATTQLYRELVT